jgi:hypothetical protein
MSLETSMLDCEPPEIEEASEPATESGGVSGGSAVQIKPEVRTREADAPKDLGP